MNLQRTSCHLMDDRKIVNGAYRHRYAPFLIHITGYNPLALPLGELSPQVTERALRLPSPSSLRSATSPIGRGKGLLFSVISIPKS